LFDDVVVEELPFDEVVVAFVEAVVVLSFVEVVDCLVVDILSGYVQGLRYNRRERERSPCSGKGREEASKK
jgi:hypothetical protein